MRRFLGMLAVLAGIVVIVVGYTNVPDAHTCQVINNINTSLGSSASCSSTPAAGYFAVAAVLVLGGLAAIFVPRRGRQP
jgi:hypothetical protein